MPDKLSKFMNIWEVEPHFKCPVVGAILSVEKHKTILKKCGYDVKKLKPYEYHQQIMAKLIDQNNVSVKVNNFIRSQARKQMVQITGLSEEKVRKLWEISCIKGNLGPMMYAIIAWEDASVNLLHDVYGQVHMQSHANMTQIFHARQQLTQADEALSRIKKQLTLKNETIKIQVEARKSDAKKISSLRADNQHLEKKITALEKRVLPWEKQEDTVGGLEQELIKLTRHLKTAQQKLRIEGREKKAIQIDLFSARSKNELIQTEIHRLIAAFKFNPPADCPNGEDCIQEACPRYELCAKRVFMIGGITKMRSFYKDIVENAGGTFDYHDGYMKNSNINLEAKVKRCDVVLCPVNCNSHNACLRVKKLCSRYNKNLKILSSSSLSAVTQALFIPETEIVLN